MRGVFLFVLMTMAGLLGAANADQHLQVAQKLMRKGRLLDAKAELLVAQRLEPTREDVAQLLAGLQGTTLTPAASNVTITVAVVSGVEEILAQARASYRNSDLKMAEEGWRRSLQIAPQDLEATAGLERLKAETYKRDGDQPFDQSVADLYEAGMREARKGRLVEAKRKLDEAMALNPMQPQVKAALAGLKQGAQTQQADRDAQQWVLEGQAALKEGEWAKAGQAFQQALKQATQLSEARAGLEQVKAKGAQLATRAVLAGQSALEQSRWDEAERQFALALALNPDQPRAAEGRKAAQAHSIQAKDQASKAQETNRLYNAGVEAWSAGDLSLAAGRFRAVLLIDPQDVEANKALLALRRKLDERVEKDRLDARRLVEEARTLETRGAPEEALKRYERALIKDPSLDEAASGKERLVATLKAP